MRRNSGTTLKDVAKAADVTVMAASVVLNGARSTARVSDATRERIVRAAAELGYRRNAAALGLSRSRMNTLGVVTTIGGDRVNAYLMEVLTGIMSAAASFGQTTAVLTIEDWNRDEKRILDFCDGRIDGVILIGAAMSQAASLRLVRHAPTVALHGDGPGDDFPNFDVDDELGSYMATRHLLDLGHRRIVHFAGSLAKRAGRLRAAGFRRAVEEAGIVFGEEMVLRGDFEEVSSYQRAMALLSRPESAWPTAIVCANDGVAFGCTDALLSRGLRIPADMSVTGFDNSLLARLARPRLTSVSQPFLEMSREAVKVLLSEIAHDRDGHPSTEGANGLPSHYARGERVFAPSLVVGESSSAPRGA